MVKHTPEHTGLILDNSNNPQNLIITDGTDSIPIQWEKDRVMQPYLDRENVLWILTDNYLYRLLSKAFRSYNYDDGLIEEPWALAADTSRGLLIGSVTNGLQYFNGKTFSQMHGFENLFPPAVAFYRGSITLSTGDVWLSTNTGVLIWNGTRFSKLKGLRENVQICSIYEDPEDRRIFIGTDIGMFISDGDSIRFLPEMSVPDMGVAEGFARTDNGNHWLAGHYGLRVFDGKTFTAVSDVNGPTEFVWGLVKDYMGNIWAAGGEGVFISSPDSLTTGPALPQKDNLPAHVIRDMGDGKLIIGRMTDVCIIDLEEYYAGNPEYYHILGRSHGFTGNDCQDNGIVRSSDGKWWILTSDGLISFDPGKLVKNETPPLSYITSVERLDNSQVWSRITEVDSSLFYSKSSILTLKKRVNALRINFTAISTTNPPGVTFNYRLQGYNNNWVNGTKERSATYDRLGPGRYVFELIAFNDDGVGTEEPVILPITVYPTFMQTLAVKISLTLLMIGLIVLLTVQVRRRITENRIRAARNQAESYRLQ
ncbi:MAG TPA: triple tyrosine motif-containing protein, partial [Bacteroidales bacterium]|nr:triple tyrosine motif-containing protein [Bacteroidales bacterium]